MESQPLIEACVNSVESAVAAEAGGADRVELCDNLFDGGTTPTAGSIALAKERLKIPVNIILRPRGGDFCYSELEFAIMKHDLAVAKDLGVDGIVLGFLTPDGRVDKARTAEMTALARPLPVTFHRAFDMTVDPFEALEDIIGLGIERILTSGQEPSVPEGLELISELVERAGDRIIIMPGAGITERNVARVVATSKAREIHVYGPGSKPSRMAFRREHVFMGGELRPPEYAQTVVDAGRIRAFCEGVGR